MVSFHASLLPASTMIQDSDDSSTKRKRERSLQPEDFLDDRHFSKTKYSKRSVHDTELHLETPMPLEWQRCLDIKSGQIYYYNTKTQKKTSVDPRRCPEPPKNNMSLDLDLELNLPCGSSSSNTPRKPHQVADNFSKLKSLSTTSNTKNVGGGALSWLALDGGDQQQEMMTAVCKKCHMLVMMSKTSPSCPNCKYMHPPNQTPPRLFNRELSLLC
ncbi:WW domain-containing protein [Artemisia annua]|uniref:WW domain-containing protein n=1 Tax=Artemisia annua TaxID=35608 RepID=A0A2U1QM62_ARTAN|nr:WW domain-containing protein [Artemisia annua]